MALACVCTYLFDDVLHAKIGHPQAVDDPTQVRRQPGERHRTGPLACSRRARTFGHGVRRPRRLIGTVERWGAAEGGAARPRVHWLVRTRRIEGHDVGCSVALYCWSYMMSGAWVLVSSRASRSRVIGCLCLPGPLDPGCLGACYCGIYKHPHLDT